MPDLKRWLKGRKARLRNPYRDFSSLKSPTRFHEEPLFKDASLGGTAFFRPLRSEHETALLIHESGALAAAEFRRKYGIEPSYPADSNSWFEKIAEIEPKWNRLVFYDGGGVFHASAIHTPKKLNADPASGRLTWNGFFICRRSMSGLDQALTAA